MLSVLGKMTKKTLKIILLMLGCWFQYYYTFPLVPLVNNIEQAINDEQVQYRNMLVDVSHPEGGSVKVPGNPIKLSSVANEEYSSPPLLGEHTKEVLQKWLNYSEEKLSKLHENEIIELKNE